MITIKITNAEHVVEDKKGWFVANVVGAFVDLEAKVEEAVMEKLRASLVSEGIEAVIERTGGTVTPAEAEAAHAKQIKAIEDLVDQTNEESDRRDAELAAAKLEAAEPKGSPPGVGTGGGTQVE